MPGVRNILARRDGSEERLSSNEQTQKVQLALKSLNPSFARLQSRGLSHRSSVPSFFSSTSPTKEAPQQRKVRSPPPVLNIHRPAQQYSRLVDSSTSPSVTVTPQNYLPIPSTLLLDLPLLPLTPPPMSPTTRKRRRFSMLSRKLGEAIPPELVFGADHIDLESRNACDGVQKNAFGLVAPATGEGEGTACVLDITSADGGSGDHHRPSVPLVRDAKGRDTQQNYTTWTLERNGRRVNIEQDDYQEVLELLRKL